MASRKTSSREHSAVILSSGRLVRWRVGGLAHVGFDWEWVMRREESQGDVVGFFHTHPAGCATMSPRDRRTMRAWALSFGKPLLCAIRCRRRVRAWLCDRAGGAEEVVRVSTGERSISWMP